MCFERDCRRAKLVPAHSTDFIPLNICPLEKGIKQRYQQYSKKGSIGRGDVYKTCPPALREVSGNFSKTGPLCPHPPAGLKKSLWCVAMLLTTGVPWTLRFQCNPDVPWCFGCAGADRISLCSSITCLELQLGWRPSNCSFTSLTRRTCSLPVLCLFLFLE